MLGFLHGYYLDGSGSCLWTRAMLRAFCKDGHDVHLICQENHPEEYDFISEAYLYKLDGTVEKFYDEGSPYEGRCILHKPQLGDLLPVYIKDKYEEFKRVVPMTELPDEEIESYIQRNIDVVEKIARENNIDRFIANHSVLMPTIAQHFNEQQDIPYGVVIHGSAIEFTVKKDKRFYNYADKAFRKADRIFYYNDEVSGRVKDLFPEQKGLHKKLFHINLGVDTTVFKPIPKEQRQENIQQLCDDLKDEKRGHQSAHSEILQKELHADITKEELKSLIQKASDYYNKLPDSDVEEKLQSIDWEKENVVIFLGRVILFKGLQYAVGAMPLILEKHPHTRLICVGHGPLREALEALVWAYQHGEEKLILKIPKWEAEFEEDKFNGVEGFEHFYDDLSSMGKWNEYLNLAAKTISPERVIFLGYLTHKRLRYLLPCCDVAIFPSIVKEAGPLVFFEAMASGVFPMGTYFGGMAKSIDIASDGLPEPDGACMKIHQHPDTIIKSLADNVNGALDMNNKYKKHLNKTALDNFDWQNIARRLYGALEEMRTAKV